MLLGDEGGVLCTREVGGQGDSSHTSPYQAIPILTCSIADGRSSLKDRIFPFALPSHSILKKQK